jgi:hypothetical protein
MSARIAESSHGRIETVTPFTLAIPAFYLRLKSRVIRWSPRTGFLLEDSDADEFERLMREDGVHRLARENRGRWALFHAGAARGSPDPPPDDPGWWWMGLGAVKTGAKARSGYLASLARSAYRAGDAARALELARRAVDAHAFNHAARQTLIQALDRLGRQGEAAEQSRALRELTEPRVKASAEFERTLQFLGYTADGAGARPGQDVRVRYFWKVKRDPGRKEGIGVFVHLESGQARILGDHRFLGGHAEPIWPALDGEILSQEEWIRIPVDAAPGTYRILLGVYDLATGRRWDVSASDAAAARRRVPIGLLRIEPAEAR